MPSRITRRQAVLGLGAAGVVGGLSACTSAVRKPDGAAVFSHGVASGDPDQNSVVLWTRVNASAMVVKVYWEIAKDQHFTDIVMRNDTETDAGRDYTVKVIAQGLAAGETYYYRFLFGDQYSPVGRTRTLPVGHVDTLGIAVTSCSNYPFGYFNAYEAIAADRDIDVVLHLGDYIYEYGPDGYGGEIGKKLGRNHYPPKEIVTLSDYRDRHAQYKADVQSQAMHASHPLIPIWDDHESTNNPWMEGAQNHQSDSEGLWQDRKRASLRAYYEWMPIREPKAGGSREQYWRDFRFGDLASLVTLETRHTGRSKQIEYPDYREQLTSREAARRFMRDVVGAPERNMLSPAGENFTLNAIKKAESEDVRWHLLGNQIPMARTHAPNLPAGLFEKLDIDPSHPVGQHLERFQLLGQLDLPIYLDPWDGYPAARERFYNACEALGVRDLLVLTGDSHSFWANALYDDSGKPMGVEIGTAGISSPGDFIDFGPEGAALLDRELAAHNKEILWTDCTRNGYVRLVLNHNQAKAEYVSVSTVLAPRFKTSVFKQFTIEHRDGTLAYV